MRNTLCTGVHVGTPYHPVHGDIDMWAVDGPDRNDQTSGSVCGMTVPPEPQPPMLQRRRHSDKEKTTAGGPLSLCLQNGMNRSWTSDIGTLGPEVKGSMFRQACASLCHDVINSFFLPI
ncbi:hypothetical protein XENORESO_012349 [Xenotaenia resolanae]|uniref:Uncharacterized protein n=1 Tax=Xenotaenia resolanae TaxID=208358 RepID=A0ABV0XB50_9TELE